MLAGVIFAFPVYPRIKMHLQEATSYRRRLMNLAAGLLTLILFLLVVAGLVQDSYNPFLYFRF